MDTRDIRIIEHERLEGPVKEAHIAYKSFTTLPDYEGYGFSSYFSYYWTPRDMSKFK